MQSGYAPTLDKAQALLQQAQVDLLSEIRNYPTPIGGCDAQFNHLLAERRKIGAALDALNSQPFIPTPRALEPARGLALR